MDTAHRLIAAVSTALLAVAMPAVATARESTPSEEEAVEEAPWPPENTHGQFLPLPEEALQPITVPACGTEVTVSIGENDETVHRVWVTDTGDTVIELRGKASFDLMRASDGATLDEVELDGAAFQTISADGTTVTFDQFGPGLLMSETEESAALSAGAGLPEDFLFLDGRFTATVTFDPETLDEAGFPAVVSAEITENITEYVFDVCDLLDQAAAGEQPDLPEPSDQAG
ncbi:hypothetical protein RCG67_06660 [Kocuria sp. CPCC 205292]|uniref:hypothetical protein n=1 Tax=Kocuria cellulosilytica TaxID=3071451 RepID=UPI0034D69C0E